MQNEDPAISAEAITKTFKPRSKHPVHALTNVSFSVSRGEVVGLIGPNGAGKTTLLRILLGFLDSDEGSAKILGDHPESLAARECLGYQADSQFRSKQLSVMQFMELHAALLGTSLPEGQIGDLLKRFSIGNTADRSLGSLSQGMRQKVELALAFLGSPDVVFLDEPTASLDPPSVFELRDFLAARKQSGVTVFFSSHNLTEVENICDRVLFILDGKIQAEYSLESVQKGFLEEAFRRHLVEKKSA
jgi:ABC-2 type transport system ATP-binding protein